MTPYHRAAAGRPWWRSLVELVLVVVLWFVASVIVYAVGMGTAGAKKLDQLDNTSRLFLGVVGLATLLPVTMLSARIVGRSPGMLSSIVGRLRKRWLVRCVGIGVAINIAWLVVFVALSWIFGDHAEAAKTGSAVDREGALKFIGFVLLTVPLQAAGEEYFFRGTLMQVVGRFIRPWPIVAVISAVAFTAAHGALSPASVTLFAMGLVLAWITVRTGGLEAAIGQHVVNNVIIFALRALAQGGESIDPKHLNEGATWRGVISQIAALAIYAYFVVRSYKRRPSRPQGGPSGQGVADPRYARTGDRSTALGSSQGLPAATDEVQQHATERRAGVEHADHGGDAQALPPQQQ